ncbi:MAG TPA: RagB/SusD family nutrient uptake outer membrane protein [Gemmatimonadaceae bacterium]|nr:RagB/SusD family nutrient uptake outer membrane protein [Gemmatimonadaceae bacterium]
MRPFSGLSMRKPRIVVFAGLLSLAAACDDFLDVNTNPNAPEVVAANLYLPPMLHWLVTGPQIDGRFVGHYTQEWLSTSTLASPAQTWGRMGYDPTSDNGAQMWRDVYWSFGQNLVDMMNIARDEQRWDVLGVGYILKAAGWQELTDIHGEIIVKEAIDQSKFSFNYDTQEFVYEEVRRLLDSALVLLARTDGAVDANYLARGDKIYNGDRLKWRKFAWGLRAINLNHYSNKASYNPDAVIQAVDSAFASNADDALLTYPNTQNDDINYLGRTRGNFPAYRQTQFVVGLMNGTVFDSVVDPRMSRMLSPSPDGQYRGLDPDVLGFGALTAAQRPNNPYGYPDLGGLGQPGRYLFDDKAKMPAMTYAQLQFVKAEAAFHKGDRARALEAYTKGVSSHIDFVNARNSDNGQNPTQITAAEKAAFLANPRIVPTAANLTLTHIMVQKYIAQWAWGHNEMWMDMRRYDYTDIDPATGEQIYPGFDIPATLYVDNANKPVQRIRPRFNSEYVWNRPALDAIGGLASDYHTVPLWITEP